jgi:hypothetical protein
MRLRNSFWALLGRDVSETPQLVIERIRKAMLFALDEHCNNDHYALDLKITFAKDVAELWYLRPDLMYALAASKNQTVAEDCIAEISTLFKGHFNVR